MEGPRMLSGEVLVAKGITKTDATLPEVGLKDVTPNGSWLEQKQIQAALEARKYLIAVERIEKCGTLSHAEWREDLMLARVTQKVGGYWQYLGHNVGKSLFLRPEEALFLMEVNCLLLKHNEVTVSLQKAYSLLLNSSTTMIEYKVYASLSRLGYRVFRHTGPEVNEQKNIYSQKCIKVYELKNDESPKFSTVGKNKEFKNVDAPIAVTNKSECVDSPVVSTLNNSEHEAILIILKAPENNDPSEISPARDSDKPQCVNTTQLHNTVGDSKSNNSPIRSQVSKLSENVEKKINNQEVTIDTNENIEMGEVKDIVEMSELYDTGNSVAKETESPNVMEVDEDAELKNANNEIETVQEMSPTNAENEVDNMEIGTEDEERIVIVIMQESDGRPEDGKAISAEKPSSMTSSDVPIRFVQMVDTSKDGPSVTYVEIETKDTGTQTIENSTESLKYKNDPSSSNRCTPTENITQNIYDSSDNDSYSYLNKIEKIMKSHLKPSPSHTMENSFKNIPDFLKGCVVTVNIPEQQFIPNNIFVNKANYELNLQSIRMRSFRSASSESPAYTSSDEVNGTNIKRIRSSSDVLGGEIPQNSIIYPHGRFSRYQQYRPYGFWRPQNNLYVPLMIFQTRIQYNQRTHPFFLRPCLNFIQHNPRKRMRNCKLAHLQSIKNLATRLKQCLIAGNTDMANLRTLHSLLHSYNQRYKTRLRLTGSFDVVNEEKIVDTIDLDDEEGSKRKKRRQEKDDDKFYENLYRLRQLASRLRDLEIKDKASATHRRALSKAIKTFNKSYDADIYLDVNNYEVIDRRCITLDSSSESDCVVAEQPRVRQKKLKNPFSILKRRSERMQSINTPGTSKDDSTDPCKIDLGPANTDKENNKYSELIMATFTDTWLPNEKDFGKAEIVPKRLMNSRIMFCNKEQFLFEFMKDDFQQYQNWSEAKISFLRYLEETNIAFKSEQPHVLPDPDLSNTGLRPLLDYEDSSDMHLVLEKLRIIENNKDIDTDTSLRVTFDVYNRNVQNFRKRSPPTPHFRIICVDDSSGVPSPAEVMALHSKYKDNVPIVFAIVSTGSISYLQINPIELPIYVPSSDLV